MVALADEKLNNTGLPREQKQDKIPSEADVIVKRVYTPKEISQQLAIGRTATYSLLDKARRNKNMFRVLKVGDSVRVLKEDFDAWLEGGAENG